MTSDDIGAMAGGREEVGSHLTLDLARQAAERATEVLDMTSDDIGTLGGGRSERELEVQA